MTGGEYYRQIIAEVRGRGNYFKAVQPDGFSFRGSPKKEYVVGETTEAEGDGNKLCDAGLLHVSDTPSETLFGRWPARLFEVRGEIIAGFDKAQQPDAHKGGAKRLEVVRELPAWMALGPNGRVVAAFLAALRTLNETEWGNSRFLTHTRLWPYACGASSDAAWASARSHARDAARDAIWPLPVNVSWESAWAAAWTASQALVVADLITPEQLATLYAPFEQALPIAELRKRAIAAYPIGKLN